MKLKNVISRVDGMKPNAFSNEVKTGWVNELENMVQTEIFLLAPEEMVEYTWEENAESELLIRAPYSKLYWIYLSAMIDFTHGEYDKYSQTMQMFNAWLQEYQIWYARTFRPADGGAVQMGYYLSAYGLAKLHGFEGTEEDWLEALRGEKGDPFTYEDFTPEQLEALRGPQGETLVSLERTAGDGSPGTVDTYTVTSNTGKTWSLQVRNGPVGPRGEQGKPGETGKAFTYDMFTEEQLEALRGPEGPQGERGAQGERGERGEAFTYDMFTEEQLEGLRGPEGPVGETGVGIEKVELTEMGSNIVTGGWKKYTITMTDGSTFSFTVKDGEPGPSGENGANGLSSIIRAVYPTEQTTDEGVVYEMSVTIGGSLKYFNFVVPFGPEGPAGPPGPAGSGTGDMTAAVYDPQGKAQDIFKYVDEKLKDVDFDVTADEVTFSDGQTFQQKYDSGDLTGQPATINGVNALTMEVDSTLTASQTDGNYSLGVNTSGGLKLPATYITAGTFAGIVSSMSNVAYTVAQMRSIILNTTDPSGGHNGHVWIKYK